MTSELLTFVNDIQAKERETIEATEDDSSSLLKRVRRRATTLFAAGSTPSVQPSSTEEFVAQIGEQEVVLSLNQRRHVQAEFLHAYEKRRRLKAENLGQEVVHVQEGFNVKLKSSIGKLDVMIKYLRARGQAEKAYAGALEQANLALHEHNEQTAFTEVDRMILTPHANEMSKLLSTNIATDVANLLQEITSFHMESKGELARLHKELLRLEKRVRQEFKCLLKGFNHLLECVRNGNSNLDVNLDPYLAEQRYRAALKVANRHAELYIQRLSSFDDSLILLRQKQAICILCAEKLFVFEALRHASTSIHPLDALGKKVVGNVELLGEQKNVVPASANIDVLDNEAPVQACAQEDSILCVRQEMHQEQDDDLKYPFQMPEAPQGTDFYGGDLQLICKSGSAREKDIDAVCADRTAWSSVRLVLTNDRILHIFDLNCSEEGEAAPIPRKSINLSEADILPLGESSSLCFEIKASTTSFVRSAMATVSGGDHHDYFLFQAPEKHSRSIWLFILTTKVNLGDPLSIAVGAEESSSDAGQRCSEEETRATKGTGDITGNLKSSKEMNSNDSNDTVKHHDYTEEAQRAVRSLSVAASPIEATELEASLDELCKNLPDDEPEFERDSIYLRSSENNDPEGQ